jgi:hypothetical protein
VTAIGFIDTIVQRLDKFSSLSIYNEGNKITPLSKFFLSQSFQMEGSRVKVFLKNKGNKTIK